MVYRVTTPTVYQLSLDKICTFYGQNNIWTDTGDVNVTYYTNLIGTADGETNIHIIGASPVIVGKNNYRYICGEVTSLTFTPCSSGMCEVIFTSGATATALTLPSEVKMPSWFTIESGYTYEINILNGIYGAVMAWPT